jgi:hypothetical protein
MCWQNLQDSVDDNLRIRGNINVDSRSSQNRPTPHATEHEFESFAGWLLSVTDMQLAPTSRHTGTPEKRLHRPQTPFESSKTGINATQDTHLNDIADCTDIYQEIMELTPLLAANERRIRSEMAPPQSCPMIKQEFTGCLVCLDGEGNYALVPCGHTGICKACSMKVRECPFCRQQVRERMRIFKP